MHLQKEKLACFSEENFDGVVISYSFDLQADVQIVLKLLINNPTACTASQLLIQRLFYYIYSIIIPLV